MFRINGPGATAQHLFTEGDPQTATPATEVTADWLNDVQEELAGFCESMGLTLNSGDRTQLAQAIGLLVAKLPGGGAEQALTIAAGSIAPSKAAITIETEGAAANDDLTNIDTTNLPDGRIVLLRAVNASHVVTVKHAAGGAGQIYTLAGADVVLNTTDGAMILQRRGASLYQVLPVPQTVEAAATLASAATVNIGGQRSGYVTITGTTAITAFSSAPAGIVRQLKFSGILTLTHNTTTLILPGGANITTAAGDMAAMVSEGAGNWRCAGYLRADGTPLTGAIAQASTTEITNESAGQKYISPDRLSASKRLAKAWVIFTGTGTVAIQSSFNVSSVTDNGAGDYTVNFTAAMASGNYATHVTTKPNTTGEPITGNVHASDAGSTTSVRVCSFNTGSGPVDVPRVSVTVFGN